MAGGWRAGRRRAGCRLGGRAWKSLFLSRIDCTSVDRTSGPTSHPLLLSHPTVPPTTPPASKCDLRLLLPVPSLVLGTVRARLHTSVAEHGARWQDQGWGGNL